MICPDENIMMRMARIDSHYGSPLILEQCQRCGGIWLDEEELFKTKQGEAEKIELLDGAALRKSSPIKNRYLYCPRDQLKLTRFKDPNFPEEIVIESCHKCRGFWLKRGEFLKYQKHRQKLVSESKTKSAKDKKLEIMVEQLLSSQKDFSSGVLWKVARFLSTPLDPYTWQPLESEKMSEKEKRALDFTTNVLTTLLNIFLRR